MPNTTATPTFDLHANVSARSTPPPWYQYEECAIAPYAFVFYFAVKVINLAIGFPSNALVIWQIVSKKKESSTSDIFILNLAILDAYFCLMGPIDMVNRMVLADEDIWCFQRFAYGVKDTAPLFLVCICVDRYVAVVHPVLFTTVRESKLRVAIALLVWCFNVSYGVTKAVLGVMSVSKVFSGVILFAFVVMLFCNLSVIWVLRRSVAGKEAMHPVKKKALKIVLIILGIIVCNYLPPVALMPFVSYYSFSQFHCQVAPSVFSIMDLSSSVEPLVYVSKMERLCGGCFGPTKNPIDVKV